MELETETQAQRDEIIRVVTRGMISGSQGAFRHFFDLVFDRLYHVLLVQTRGDEDLSKELAQVIMIRCVTHIPPFENERMLWGWLRQVARNCHVDWLRRKGREPQMVPLEVVEHAVTAPERDEQEELLLALDRSLNRLEADEREILQLAYFEGVTQQSMASKLNTTAKAIESKLGRIRQKLRRILLEKMKDYALF